MSRFEDTKQVQPETGMFAPSSEDISPVSDTYSFAAALEKHEAGKSLNDMGDGPLLAAFRSNQDERAFAVLASRYEVRLHNFALREVHNHETAADLVQETFLRLVKAENVDLTAHSLSSYLHRILLNANLDRIRSERLRPTVPLILVRDGSDEGALLLPDTRTSMPADEAVRNERLKLVRSAIDELPERQRRLLVERELRGMSYEEISVVENLNIGTVKSQLHTARQALAQVLRSRVA